ncbi:MAG: ParB N-terminal domain-containing protein, partial [Burkholderiales bacterium]|nr:ParB N-terminal domain-containing protein [Burkholderiales bacterium]
MAKPKTAPGTMLQFIGQQSETVKELEILRDQVKSFEGARPAKQLDPKLVKPSRWANRHAASFENAKFKSLMAEIESAGGNIQPIKVRPIGGTTESYEIVFGHRRHQACLQLGLP